MINLTCIALITYTYYYVAEQLDQNNPFKTVILPQYGPICLSYVLRNQSPITSTSNTNVGMILSPSMLSNPAINDLYSGSLPAPNAHDQFSTLNYIQVR